jgi:hypothetical protein
MNYVTFIQILKPAWDVVGKKQMAEGKGDIEGRQLMQSYRMREGVMLL